MEQPNFYSAGAFDRAGRWRKDALWLEARLADPSSRFTLVWNAQHLTVERDERLEALLLASDEVAELRASALPILLGLDGDQAYFALAIDDRAPGTPVGALEKVPPGTLIPAPLDTASKAPAGLNLDRFDGASFADLRRVGPLLPARDAALLAYARGMAHWHGRHRFCGVCGHPTEPAEAGHVRRCKNPACATTHFPRTDPAVIMLVTNGDQCLVGRQAAWPAGMYSTLAGFVEPGESLEDAVLREVFEESGIVARDPVYHSSQPWPFPSSIMLGFHAKAVSREIRIDPSELEDARWVTRDDLARADRDGPVKLPPPVSIARRLIEDWIRDARG